MLSRVSQNPTVLLTEKFQGGWDLCKMSAHTRLSLSDSYGKKYDESISQWNKPFIGEWPVQQSEDMGLSLYIVVCVWDGVCEGINQCILSTHHAASSSQIESSCDGQTGSLLGSASPPPHLISTSPALLTALINITVCCSLSRGLPSEEFVHLTDEVEER